MAGIKDMAVYGVPVRVRDPVAALAGWGAKGLAQAESAFVPDVGSGRLINKASRATSSCAPNVTRR
jgi:hypothetical protein